MRVVFVDSVYWIAIVRPGDPWRDAAQNARDSLGAVEMVTTDQVLFEFLNALSRGGRRLRKRGAEMVRAILQDRTVSVVPQTRDLFLRGVERYEQRLDKEYSLTDCVSMNVMEARGITDALTNDHHFAQEGFRVLMRPEDRSS
jgi:predicted nucleic acid-binding protein